jgi:serine/threonine protein kinase
MFIDPDVGEIIIIDGEKFEFIQVPRTPGIVYAELGKKAKVYRIKQAKKAYALKVFKPAYRNPNTAINSKKINSYQSLPGLSVAERVIITPEQYPDLVNEYPDFAYSILMPWVEGKSWGNYIVARTSVTRVESLKLANALIRTLHGLEENNLAHCDLSGGNFIFSDDFTRVELLDIEELYGKELKQPDPLPIGTGGYTPKWVNGKGLWDSKADRFSAGILVSEVLAWQFENIRMASSNGDAYFASEEIGQNSKRFKLLSSRLEQIDSNLPNLLHKLWYSKSAEECPSLANWQKVLEQVPEQPVALNWEWEALGLPVSVTNQEEKVPVSPPEKTYAKKPSPTQPQKAPVQIPQKAKKTEPDIVAHPWPSNPKKQAVKRDQSINKIFGTFSVVGVILFFITLLFGDLVRQITRTSFQISGWILPNIIGSTILAFITGSVHSWIFRNNMKDAKGKNFILSATIGGLVGGSIGGILTSIGLISNSLLIGAIIGGIAGAVSSERQGPFLQNQDLRKMWFNFSTISWIIAWVMGGAIHANVNSIVQLATAAMIIIVSNGGMTAWFLRTHPEIEF